MTLLHKLAALAVLLAGLYVAHAWDKSRAVSAAYAAGQAETQARWDQERIEQQALALLAEQQERAKEQALIEVHRRQDEIDAKKLADARAAVARSDAVARRMRERADALEAAARSCPVGDDPAAASERQSAQEAADLLSDMRRRLAEARAATVVYADAAGAAAESCEGRYDGLTAR